MIEREPSGGSSMSDSRSSKFSSLSISSGLNRGACRCSGASAESVPVDCVGMSRSLIAPSVYDSCPGAERRWRRLSQRLIVRDAGCALDLRDWRLRTHDDLAVPVEVRIQL